MNNMFENYKMMRSRLAMWALPETNKDILEAAPHKMIGDIAIIFCLNVHETGGMTVSTVVTYDMLEQYGVSVEQLMCDAAIYAPRNNPVKYMSLDKAMSQLGNYDVPEGTTPVIIATLPDFMHGAGIMGYPNFFKDTAEKIGSGYYIIPSSVHEILLLPDGLSSMSAREMTSMVRDINVSTLDPREYLSNQVYHYDAQMDLFERAENYEERGKNG